jgi:hypothetical protein
VDTLHKGDNDDDDNNNTSQYAENLRLEKKLTGHNETHNIELSTPHHISFCIFIPVYLNNAAIFL